MKDIIYLLLHLLTTTAKMIQPGGSRAVIAENLLLKQQLIIHSRARQRAPNLTTQDRTLLGVLSLLLKPRRLVRSAIIRELLDQTFFWTATDLENKLRAYQRYFNECRTHSGRDGATPAETSGNTVADINKYRWKKHCRGLFQLPVAA